MGEHGRVACRRDFAECERLIETGRRIDEQGQIGIPKIQRMLDLQLKIVQRSEFGKSRRDAFQ